MRGIGKSSLGIAIKKPGTKLRPVMSSTVEFGTLSTDLILKYAVQPYFMITTAEPHERQSISQGQIGATGP